ncbi:MAG: GTP 3',8-cyclase MoaA [Desulfobacteraceae bacterium]
MPVLNDRHNRTIDYLRISITDHCNLQCHYCVPFDGRPKLPMADILSYEELFAVAKAAVAAGVTKIRLTGGEPLMRLNMLKFCEMLRTLPQIKDLAVTTNGILLESMAHDLKSAGVDRVNVSLDTLDAERYAQITGKDGLESVLSGIRKAMDARLAPLKINMVPMRGINDDEIVDMARWSLSAPIDIRFIELMPTSGWAMDKHEQSYIPVDEVRRKVEQIGPLEKVPQIETRGPATYARLPNAQGRIGFISAVSHSFCSTCNRLRLTADGKLRACLFAEQEIDIKGPLRDGADLNTLKAIIQSTAAAKPAGHRLDHHKPTPTKGRLMRSIGG